MSLRKVCKDRSVLTGMKWFREVSEGRSRTKASVTSPVPSTFTLNEESGLDNERVFFSGNLLFLHHKFALCSTTWPACFVSETRSGVYTWKETTVVYLSRIWVIIQDYLAHTTFSGDILKFRVKDYKLRLGWKIHTIKPETDGNWCKVYEMESFQKLSICWLNIPRIKCLSIEKTSLLFWGCSDIIGGLVCGGM